MGFACGKGRLSGLTVGRRALVDNIRPIIYDMEGCRQLSIEIQSWSNRSMAGSTGLF